MFLFILSLLLSFNVETYTIEKETYILFSSDEKSLSFSSFRLKNPDRIFLELDAESLDKIKIPSGSLIHNVDIKGKEGKLRILFDIKEGSFYQILNRDNMILLGIGGTAFSETSDFESVYAKVQIEKESSLKIAQNKEESLIKELLAKEEKIRKDKELERVVQLKVQEEKRRHEEESRRIEQIKEESRLAELKREEDEKRALAERKRLETEEKERKLAELERQAELKREEAERKRLETEEKERKLAELKRQAELKREEAERKRLETEEKERKLAELKRQAELKREEAERKRLETEEKERKLAELKRNEDEKRMAKADFEEKELRKGDKSVLNVNSSDNALKAVSIVNENGENIELPVKRKISEDSPLLPVVKMRASGKLKNLYFRKFPEFSRVTLDLTGEVDYRFREINGGYVIDVHNMKKIPRHLLYIIDARAFNSVVKYIYPQKKDGVFKIYIKTDENLAVRKSSEGSMVNFDFYIPQLN